MSFRSEFLQGLPHITAATFEAAALALFRHQATHCPPYAAFLAQLGRDPTGHGPAAGARLLPYSAPVSPG